MDSQPYSVEEDPWCEVHLQVYIFNACVFFIRYMDFIVFSHPLFLHHSRFVHHS